MCQFCLSTHPHARLSRRGFTVLALASLAAAGAPGQARAATTLIEPELRLATLRPGERKVALTLDACPGHFDMRIAEALVADRIPATIFVTALWIEHNAEGLHFLLAHPDLFALENHGARHLPPVLGDHPVYGLRPAGTLEAVRREVADGAAAVTAATGRPPQWYRGAAALYSPEAITAIQQMGFAIAGFSLNSDMGASLPATTVAARIARASSGSVIIGHINQPTRPSGAGIAAGVQALKAAGMTFVRLDAAAGMPVA